MKRIAVLLVEDHMIVRQGVRLLIEVDGDIEIIGEAKTGREAVQLAAKLSPDIIVMDIAMPLLNGLQATRQILKMFPKMKVLILSAHSDPEYIDQVSKAGAQGYLVKQTSGDILAKAIRGIHEGKTYFSPAITQRLKPGRVKRSETELTPREAELLQLIAEGHVNKQIASELGISIKTVEKHRQHLMDKLNIHDIAGLTRHAIATGMIESNALLNTHSSP